MGYYEAKAERSQALLRALGHMQEESKEPAQPEGKVDFDGGVREPALTSDPEREHNEFVLRLFENTKLGGGGEW
jgi:hypothetical protein